MRSWESGNSFRLHSHNDRIRDEASCCLGLDFSLCEIMTGWLGSDLATVLGRALGEVLEDQGEYIGPIFFF